MGLVFLGPFGFGSFSGDFSPLLLSVPFLFNTGVAIPQRQVLYILVQHLETSYLYIH